MSADHEQAERFASIQLRISGGITVFTVDDIRWLAARLDEAQRENERLREALKQIANGQTVTKAVSDPMPAVIDGEASEITYVEMLRAHEIARMALAASSTPKSENK